MKAKIKWAYKVKKADIVYFESEWIEQVSMFPLIHDIEKLGKLHQLTIVDEMDNEWTVKEYVKLSQKLEEEPDNVVIYFDGGYDKQNAIAGIGMVLYYQKSGKNYRIRSNERLEALVSNNEAEYAALYNALQLLEEAAVSQLPCIIRGDAQGLLKQLQGEWPCYEELLNTWLDRIEARMKGFSMKPTFEIVNRKENKEADQLATQALQGTMIHSHSVV